MLTYNETSQMQQRYAELNKPAVQTEGWTCARPNAIDRAVAGLKAMFTHSKPQPKQPATRKPAGAH